MMLREAVKSPFIWVHRRHSWQTYTNHNWYCLGSKTSYSHENNWHDDNNITNVTNPTDSCTGFSRAHPSPYLTGTRRSIYKGKAILTSGSRLNAIQYPGEECTDRAVRRHRHAFWRYPVRPSLLEERLYLTLHKAITRPNNFINTVRTGDADLRLYITTVQDGW